MIDMRHLTIGILTLALNGTAAFADEVRSSTSSVSSQSSSSSTEVVDGGSGVAGVRSANKFAPKFKERLKNLMEQIELGITKGWITTDQADSFKKEHARVAAEEAVVSKNNYLKAEVDQLEKDVTALNHSVTSAMTVGAKPKSETTTTTTTEASAETKKTAPAKTTKTTTKTTTKAKPKAK